MVSYKKMSKKAQKAENQKQRGNWGMCNPVTRVVKAKKGKGSYDRRAFKQGE